MWVHFQEREPENERKIEIVLLGNGNRKAFYSNGKFYKNESKRDEGRELSYITRYKPFNCTEQNMATHWRYI